MKLEETQEKIAILNRMAKVLINLKSDDHESRKLAKYDFTKMNMTESITLGQLNKDILILQRELSDDIDEYEREVRRLETLLQVLDTSEYFDEKSNVEIQWNL